MNVLAIKEVSFSYLPSQPVFEQINLTIGQGRFLAMVGPNGAGKSTLLKLCVGLLKPTAGRIELLGTPLEQFKDWSKVVYIAQQTLRDRNFPATVEEVVAMGRVAPVGIGNRLKKADYDLVEEMLITVGMQDFRKRMIGELSGGQQQRVAIAKALVAKPEVLLLDEATSGVDTATRENIYSLLRSINQAQRMSIIMVSHDVECISHYADQIANVDGGITYYGDPADFQQFCRLQRGSRPAQGDWGKISYV